MDGITAIPLLDIRRMIVREFLTNPEMPFDFFNDYGDTMRYLQAIADFPLDPEEGTLARTAYKRIVTRFNEWRSDNVKPKYPSP